MKVWLVLEIDWEYGDPHAVFSSYEQAEQWANAHGADYSGELQIHEFTVDATPTSAPAARPRAFGGMGSVRR